MSLSLIRFRLAAAFPLVAAVTLSAFTGCASSTVLQTQPPGARVLVNGMPAGNTPYTLTDTKIVGSTTQLRFEYPGYQPLDVMIARNEEVQVAPLILGIFLLIPLLWVMGYQANHVYQLQPAGAYGSPPGYSYPPPAPNGPAGYPPPPPGYPPPAGAPQPGYPQQPQPGYPQQPQPGYPQQPQPGYPQQPQ